MQYAFRVCPIVQFSPQPYAVGSQTKLLSEKKQTDG